MSDRSKRISYSELKTWNECSYKHKLVYIDEIGKFNGNEYTAFGTAIHLLCENKVLNNSCDSEKIFLEKFDEEISTVDIVDKKNPDLMRSQFRNIEKDLLPELKSKFGTYTVVSVEEQLFEPISIDYKGSKESFKGFVDLVIKTKDGKYHIIDWKSCSWGWDARKKNDKILAYQLVLYKKYFSDKHGIPLSDIETHFGLLKRTAKKNSVEIFAVSSGKKRIENSLNLLSKAAINIDKKVFMKNRLSCKYCEFYKTEHCV